ncbi:hypothetical protein H8356DRAFT_1075763 [Neocallimastix lanati (nom. inval.)]|uniref:Uncharacterized protein n=1 Tax=Neocallimastix californiae TaxID=1754190 RepID=A0A1Y2ETK3_9FUNG|nr:hypothetical protein H8356DRAFT_1075763 [Neocallimastix sp. JGI-2020a]ORY74898.1 hypothetical protein LY90DRAFT_502327 [Neocallimastix californiae]|eukprot:ORY74898.1 hypothetical protein LY90DRAFT_502327 [Neocallimastix californiae]
MAPKSKKKTISPTNSSESIISNKPQTNSIENVHKDSKAGSQNSLGSLNKMNDIYNPSDEKSSVYDITTTYKTEVVECTVDPETGETIEVITEVYVTDTINLNKKEDPVKDNIIKDTLSTDELENFDVEEVLKQLNMGTEICKELLG